MEYASVWIRFAALVIDGLLAAPFAVPALIGFALLDIDSNGAFDTNTSTLALTLLAVSWVATLIFVVWNTMVRMGKTGQSLGRKFLNIAVLDNRGLPIGVGSAVMRETIGRFLSGLVCYIGYLNAFWDSRNQMWHDKIAGSYVYYVTDAYTKTGPGAPQTPDNSGPIHQSMQPPSFPAPHPPNPGRTDSPDRHSDS